MALNEETVRRIVREELAKVVAGVDRLVAAAEAAEEGSGGLLGEEAAAAYLGGLPLTTLRNLVKKHDIGCVKLGRSVVAFKREQLDEYIDAHTLKPIDNPWGLTDAALQHIRDGRATG